MRYIIVCMLLLLLIPIYQTAKEEDIWQRMLAASSVSTKAAVMTLAVAAFRDDEMMTVVGVLILTVGNAGIMLLAHLLRKISS